MRHRVQYQFAEATGGCVVQQAGPADALEIRERKEDFDGSRCIGRTGCGSRSSAAGAGVSATDEVEVDLCGCIAGADSQPKRPRTYDVWANGNSDGEAVVDESEPAEYSDSHGTWTGDSGGVHCRAGARTAGRGLFADRTAIAGTLLKGQAAGGGVSTRR